MSKSKKNGLYIGISSIIIVILCVFIMLTLKDFSGKSSVQVKSALEFLENLQSINAIKKKGDFDIEKFKEIKKDTDLTNSKYTIVNGEYVVELNEDYKVIGFSTESEKNKRKKEISKKEAIEYANIYLNKISKEKFTFKELRDNEKEEKAVYTIAFYSLYNDYVCYSSEIILKINKYDGSLIGYSNNFNDKLVFESENNINEDECEKTFNLYMKELGIEGQTVGVPKLGYINVDGKKKQLCYILNYKIDTEEDDNKYFDMIINAKDGQVINYTNNVIELIPND